MKREDALYKAAARAANAYYRTFLQNASYADLENEQGKKKSKDDILAELAEKFYDKLMMSNPEDAWTWKSEKAYELAKPEDLAKALTFDENPIDQKKVEFSAFSSLVAPEKGKNWYGLNSDQMKYKMKELGYDSSDKRDVEEFYKRLQEHQQNYDRGQIVKETMFSPGGITAAILAPSATEEAARQSLSGDFDESRMNRAVVADAAADLVMGVGPATRILGGTPIRTGVTAAMAEGGRQAFDASQGRDYDIGAALGAGIAAGTVPTIARGIGWKIAQGGSAEARPIARGFARGLRNIDPVEQEKALLKQELVNTRYNVEQAIAAAKKGSRAYRKSGPRNVDYSESEMSVLDSYNEAAKKLRALGFESEASEAFGVPGTPNASIEEILGKPPQMIDGRLVYKSPYKRGIDAAMKEYEKPIRYRGSSSTASRIPEKSTAELNEGYREVMKGAFPAKVEKEMGSSTPSDKRLYNIGLALGRGFGGAGTQIEPIAKVEPSSMYEFATGNADDVGKRNVDKVVKTKWFKNLAKENPQKAYAIEKALGGAK